MQQEPQNALVKRPDAVSAVGLLLRSFILVWGVGGMIIHQTMEREYYIAGSHPRRFRARSLEPRRMGGFICFLEPFDLPKLSFCKVSEAL